MQQEVRACAACLASDVRLHNMSVAGLLPVYQLLAGSLPCVGLPAELCWQCAALASKFLVFRDRCRRAHALLQRCSSEQISKETITSIDRKQAGLGCPLAVKTVFNLSLSGQVTASRATRRLGRPRASKKRKEPSLVEREIKKEDPDVHSEEMEYPEEMPVDASRDNCHDTHDAAEQRGSGGAHAARTPQQDQRKISERRTNSKPKQKKSSRAGDIGAVEVTLTQEQRRELVRERQSDARYVRAPYKCALCVRPFTSDASYRNHMMQHDPVSGELPCPVCELRYKTRRKLTAHMRLHTKKYVCEICAHVTYNRIMARVHFSWHKGTMYSCKVCGAKFSTKRRHLVHVRTKHPSQLACADCGAAFVSERGLRYHAKLLHTVKLDSGRAQALGPYCAACGVQFTSAAAWTRHVLISPRHLGERASISNGCRACGETFESERALQEHVRARHARWRAHRQPGARAAWPQPCAQCGEEMPSQMAYWSHFRRAHAADEYPLKKPLAHICDECGKGFKCNSLLELHKNVHTDTRIYPCGVCSKSFFQKLNLKKHMLVHSDERPYMCDICARGFKEKPALVRHNLVHTGERPFKCDMCEKAFTTRHSQRLHARKVHFNEHVPYKPRVRTRKPVASAS